MDQTTNTAKEVNKTIGIVSYLTIFGLIAAFVMNKDKEDAFGTYHIRQSLGLMVTGLALAAIGMVPILGWIVSILGSFLLLILWIMGLINAVGGKMQPVPVLGKKFEEWFRTI
jgi:uncharacterized membrane protein